MSPETVYTFKNQNYDCKIILTKSLFKLENIENEFYLIILIFFYIVKYFFDSFITEFDSIKGHSDFFAYKMTRFS